MAEYNGKSYDPDAPLCQDDYEWLTNTGRYAITNQLQTIGYAEKGAAQRIEAFMQQPGACLVDIRLSPWCSWDVQWCKSALSVKYGKAYLHLRTFGNVNHGKGLPIELLNPEKHLAATVRALQRGRSLMLLCACADYATCHRKAVYDLVSAALQQAEQQAATTGAEPLSRMDYDKGREAMKGRLLSGETIYIAIETFLDALSSMPMSYLDVPAHWVKCVDGKTVWLEGKPLVTSLLIGDQILTLPQPYELKNGEKEGGQW